MKLTPEQLAAETTRLAAEIRQRLGWTSSTKIPFFDEILPIVLERCQYVTGLEAYLVEITGRTEKVTATLNAIHKDVGLSTQLSDISFNLELIHSKLESGGSVDGATMAAIKKSLEQLTTVLGDMK